MQKEERDQAERSNVAREIYEVAFMASDELPREEWVCLPIEPD